MRSHLNFYDSNFSLWKVAKPVLRSRATIDYRNGIDIQRRFGG